MNKKSKTVIVKEAPSFYDDRVSRKPARDNLYARIEEEKFATLKSIAASLDLPLYKVVELAIDLLKEDYDKKVKRK
jgi:hypothetical protein